MRYLKAKMAITGIILAGGKNLRLGRNKALERIGGIPLIERVAGRLRPIANELIAVTNQCPCQLQGLHGARMVSDVYPGKGPLGGIYSGLLASADDIAMVVATDMPFLSTALLHHLVELSPEYDVVVPRWNNGMIEALHSIYRKACLPVMKRQLESGKLSIRPVFEKLNVRYVEEDECRCYDPKLRSFFNINRQADVDMALKMEAADSLSTSESECAYCTTGGK
jgi:molybdopterin-guanine dinucleotide biosynthesis protein A